METIEEETHFSYRPATGLVATAALAVLRRRFCGPNGSTYAPAVVRSKVKSCALLSVDMQHEEFDRCPPGRRGHAHAKSGRPARRPARIAMLVLGFQVMVCTCAVDASLHEPLAETSVGGGSDNIAKLAAPAISQSLPVGPSSGQPEHRQISSPIGRAFSQEEQLAATHSAAVSRPAEASVDLGRAANFVVTLSVLIGILGLSLLSSLVFAAKHLVVAAPTAAASRGKRHEEATDFEERCRLLLQHAGQLWHSAEAAVFSLDSGVPLRTLLFNELKLISKRLAANPAIQSSGDGAITVNQTPIYWKMLSRDIARSVKDLERICAVAEAGKASFGDRTNEPRAPTTKEEAYFALGANSDVGTDTLERLVRALRQCWHPDLAQNSEDRRYREARIRQINVANDIINGRGA